MTKQILSVGLLAFAVQVCSAQTGSAPMGTPVAGIVREPDHTLHPVYGVAGNLITGQALPLHDVQAASFSDEAGIVLSSGAVKLVNLDGSERASYSTAESQPVLGISQGPETAVAWLPSEQTLIRWTSAGFAPLLLDASGLPGPIVEVRTIAPGTVDLWLQTQTNSIQHVRVSIANGAITTLQTTAGIIAPVVATKGSLIFYDADGLELQSAQSQSHTLPLNLSKAEISGLTFESASANWIHIASGSSGRQWMLRLGASGPSLCALPAVSSTQTIAVNQ
jgi:hypothetical protein